MSSPRSETEWANHFTGLYVHTTSPSVGLGPSWSRQVQNHTYQQDKGYQWGRGGERPPSLGASPMWPHGGISQFQCSSLCKGDRFEGRMQDGTVTTESSHGRMGSVGRTPAGCHSGLGTSVHTLQSRSIYSYSRVLGHGRAQWIVGSHVLGFLPSPYRWVYGESWLQSVRGERLHLPCCSDCNHWGARRGSSRIDPRWE
jgi:hypothetical protein